MRSTLDIEDRIYQVLNVPSLTNIISGKVLKRKRPVYQKTESKEDVVINCLPITGDQLQSCVSNVNIHVPNLVLTIAGQPDNDQPDTGRLNEIFSVVEPLLESFFLDDVDGYIQSITVIEEEDLNEHFMNIRLQIHSINLKN